MKRLLIVVALLAGLTARAQETYTFAQRDTCELKLDIYRPAEAAQGKPAVMFVFGGGFISGARNDKYLVEFYNKLTENGYPVVAVDYRLGMKGVKVGNGLSGAFKASKAFYYAQEVGVEDVFSAVAYLREHPELGIDTDNLVVAGNSAGAIISLASEYAIISGKQGRHEFCRCNHQHKRRSQVQEAAVPHPNASRYGRPSGELQVLRRLRARHLGQRLHCP